jgi:hypothetical protein
MARRFVLSRNFDNEEAKARYRAVKIQPQWVVTPGKQTNKPHNYIDGCLPYMAVQNAVDYPVYTLFAPDNPNCREYYVYVV